MSGWAQSDVTKLSEEAQTLVRRMLDTDAMPNEIRRAVHRLTGERVMLTAISYFAAHYTKSSVNQKQARTQTDDFIRLAAKKGVTVSELQRAILVESLFRARRRKQFTKADLYKLEDAERKRREFELKQKRERQAAKRERKELEMKEREVRLAEEKLRLVRKRMKPAIEKLDRKAQAGQSLTAAEVQRIREIYGLAKAEDSGLGKTERRAQPPQPTEKQRHGE